MNENPTVIVSLVEILSIYIIIKRIYQNSYIIFFVSGVAEGARKPTSPPKTKSGGDLTDECPESNGFFADGFQCDKYYECRDGVIEEKLCPDGMVFNDYSPQVEKCDLPFNIDCSERPERREFFLKYV